MAVTVNQMQRRLGAFAAEIDGTAMDKWMLELGKKCVGDAEAAVRVDIGDLSMSRWWRRSPIAMTARAELKKAKHVEVRPPAKTRGPWRVLEQGRQSYAAGDRRVSGRRFAEKKGEWVTKYRRVKRATGAAAGKETWSDALDLMTARAERDGTRHWVDRLEKVVL